MKAASEQYYLVITSAFFHYVNTKTSTLEKLHSHYSFFEKQNNENREVEKKVRQKRKKTFNIFQSEGGKAALFSTNAYSQGCSP